jgi:hypothetical protein
MGRLTLPKQLYTSPSTKWYRLRPVCHSYPAKYPIRPTTNLRGLGWRPRRSCGHRNYWAIAGAVLASRYHVHIKARSSGFHHGRIRVPHTFALGLSLRP